MRSVTYHFHELLQLMQQMSYLYDVVRTVDPEECRELIIHESGQVKKGQECFRAWDRNKRCEYCGSYKACMSGERLEKIEYYKDNTYHILMIPIRFMLPDQTKMSCVLECITKSKGIPENVVVPEKKEPEDIGIDPLTGLSTETRFYERAQKLIQKEGGSYYIVAYDISHIEVFREVFGKDKYNEIFSIMGRKLKSLQQPDEVCARLSDGCFVCLVNARNFVEEKLSSIFDDLPEKLENNRFPMVVQAGVYEVTDLSLEVDAMCEMAIMALKSIQDRPGVTYAYFDDCIKEKVLEEQRVIANFRSALDRGEFHIYLQPQVYANGKIQGAEALCRWIKDTGEIVPPVEFIEVLERSELIAKLDAYVWEQAVKVLKSWTGTDMEELYISVNISPKDFYYIDVYQVILDLIEKYGIDRKRLKLEITENFIMGDEKQQLHLVNSLHDAGFDIEIDDFGKGYSSLSALKNIQADVLKIDKEFIKETENSVRSENILATVIDMSNRLDMNVITEGVETKEQLERMVRLGCNMFQGFFFAKPMEVADFEMLFWLQQKEGEGII